MNNSNGHLDQISNKLLSFLQDELKESGIEYSSGLEPLTGGYETSIYRFQLTGTPVELSKPLVLRLHPEFHEADQAMWEGTIQNVLAGQGLPVARVYFKNADKSILGGVFCIMDHLPGTILDAGPDDDIPRVLGKTHADLHNLDPAPVIGLVGKKGTDEYKLSYSRLLDRLNIIADTRPWIREGLDWLIENRPPDPSRLVMCHRDFHGHNILVIGDKVTGILDWGGFRIADPALDVASTLMLITITGRYMPGEIIKMERDLLATRYLAAYQAHTLLDSTHLEYYQVFRCLSVLARGDIRYFPSNIRPHIIRDLTAYIKKVTGIDTIIAA